MLKVGFLDKWELQACVLGVLAAPKQAGRWLGETCSPSALRRCDDCVRHRYDESSFSFGCLSPLTTLTQRWQPGNQMTFAPVRAFDRCKSRNGTLQHGLRRVMLRPLSQKRRIASTY